MKTAKSLAAILFALLTAQSVFAYYCPATGRWLSRDPVGEPGFENLRAASAMPQVRQVASTATLPPGRWVQRDPLPAPASQSSSKRAKSVTIGESNRYLFVDNNPITFVDSDGLDVIAIPIGRIGGIGAGAGGIGIGGAIGIGAGVGIGTGLLLDTYTPVGNIGTWIGNRICPLRPPFRETCFFVRRG